MAKSTMTLEQLQAMVEKLAAENEALKAQRSSGTVGWKVDDIGRFCITGVRGQKGNPFYASEFRAFVDNLSQCVKDFDDWNGKGLIAKNNNDPAFAQARAARNARYAK